jgi:hypothetical protein
MATYIPSTPSLGERLGKGLGSGLGEGLANIAEHKLKQIQTKRETETKKEQFKKIGMNDAEADFYAGQDAETQYYGARDAILRDLKDKGGDEQTMDDWFPKTPQEFQKVDKLRQENIGAQEAAQTNAQPTLQDRLQQGMQSATQATGMQPAMQGLQAQAPTQQATPTQKRPRRDFEGLTWKQRPEETKRELAGLKSTTGKPEQKYPKQVVDRAYKALDLADEFDSAADDMEALLTTGQVASNVSGYSPKFLQTSQTQDFASIGDELAITLASKSGIASNFKVKLSQNIKPNITDNLDTQKSKIKRLRKKSKQLRQRAGEITGNTQTIHERPEQLAVGSVVDEDTENIPVGTKGVDEDTGKTVTFNGTDWV